MRPLTLLAVAVDAVIVIVVSVMDCAKTPHGFNWIDANVGVKEIWPQALALALSAHCSIYSMITFTTPNKHTLTNRNQQQPNGKKRRVERKHKLMQQCLVSSSTRQITETLSMWRHQMNDAASKMAMNNLLKFQMLFDRANSIEEKSMSVCLSLSMYSISINRLKLCIIGVKEN